MSPAPPDNHEGIPDSQMYKANTTMEITAVAAIASAAPSAARSWFTSLDMVYSNPRVVSGRHYTSIAGNPKPLSAAQANWPTSWKSGSNLMNIMTIWHRGFSGKVAPLCTPAHALVPQEQDL